MNDGKPGAGGEGALAAALMARILPAALLLGAVAVTSAAAVRPLVAFVEPPPRRLELNRDGRLVVLERLGPMPPLAQPWQVDSDGGALIRGYRYRPIGTAAAAKKEVIVWLRSSASSARSSMAYGGGQPARPQQEIDDGSCLPTTTERMSGNRLGRLLPFNPETLLSRQGRDGRNSLWKQLAWLTGSHPIRQKNCYWIEN